MTIKTKFMSYQKIGVIDMVDQWTGEWTEEKDYSTYPKEKWCDCDYMAVWIREQGYKPKTSMENLITNIFLHYDCETEEESSSYNTENGNFEGTYVEAVQAYVTDTGLSEFDYEAQIGVMEMNNIFVIDKTTKCNLGILDFTPRKDDRISMKASEWKEIEVVVECVLYEPLEHATLVFVSVVEPYYTAMVKEIKW